MNDHHIKNIGDVLSAAVVGATLITWLPPIAALITILWTVMRIVIEWPSFIKKVKGWFG
jgi:hypothetical protein